MRRHYRINRRVQLVCCIAVVIALLLFAVPPQAKQNTSVLDLLLSLPKLTSSQLQELLPIAALYTITFIVIGYVVSWLIAALYSVVLSHYQNDSR